MGKHLRGEAADDQLEGNNPSCMWGVLNALDYHHWHGNIKKMLPHKKHNGPRHAKGNGCPKTRLNVHNSNEDQKHLDAEASHFIVNQSTKKSSPTNKRSLRASTKALISEQIAKEERRRRSGSGFPALSRLQRTYSIHHLEPSDDGSHGKSTGGDTSVTRLHAQGHMEGTKKPVACNEKYNVDCRATDVLDYSAHEQLAENNMPEKSEKSRETSANKKHMEAKYESVNTRNYECKECADFLEMFSINRDLFLKNLQTTDDGIANCFHSFQASNGQARLTKSGSFPIADLSRRRNFRPSKLKNKQNEVWAFPKREKLFHGVQAARLIASKSLKDLYTKLGPPVVDDSEGELQNQDASFSSMDSTEGLDKQQINKVVKDPLYEIKLTVEHAVGEHNDISNFNEMDGFIPDLISKSTPTLIRRTSSLNESLEKYAQLFDSSFGRETKLHLSKSLRLINDSETPSGGHAPISFKRISSLPNPDSCFSLQNGGSCHAYFSGIPITKIVDCCKNVNSDSQKSAGLPVGAENYISLGANEEIGCLYNKVERCDSSLKKEHQSSLTVNEDKTIQIFGFGEERDVQMFRESNLDKEEEIALSGIANNAFEQLHSVSVLQSCIQEDVTCPADSPTSEGLEGRSNHIDEKESAVDLQDGSSDSSLWSCSRASPESYKIGSKSVENQSHIKLFTNDSVDLNYVREIIERSGINRNGFPGSWHSLDQLLNPTVFEEVETLWPHEPQLSGEETGACCHHLLLFDLMNEILLQIYDSSFTYCPRALSFSCHLRLIPVGYHVLEEVWARISSLRPEVDQSLDSVVVRDLGKADGWMNLQLETECVGLELEDTIFDELLEELICS